MKFRLSAAAVSRDQEVMATFSRADMTRILHLTGSVWNVR